VPSIPTRPRRPVSSSSSSVLGVPSDESYCISWAIWWERFEDFKNLALSLLQEVAFSLKHLIIIVVESIKSDRHMVLVDIPYAAALALVQRPNRILMLVTRSVNQCKERNSKGKRNYL